MHHPLRSRASSAGLAALAGALVLGLAGTAHAATFSNATPITINDAAPNGQGGVPAASTPYPSPIAVSGVVGTVTKVTATLHGFHHQCPTDVDILLVGPLGQKSILMSDAGDCQEPSGQPAPIELTFDDAAPPVPCLNTSSLPGGTYAPTVSGSMIRIRSGAGLAGNRNDPFIQAAVDYSIGARRNQSYGPGSSVQIEKQKITSAVEGKGERLTERRLQRMPTVSAGISGTVSRNGSHFAGAVDFSDSIVIKI